MEMINQNIFIPAPILVPILAGLYVLLNKKLKDEAYKKQLTAVVLVTLAVEVLLVAAVVVRGGSFELWKLTDTITIGWKVDDVSRLFAVLTSVVWLLVGIYAVDYMNHEHAQSRFFGYYLIVVGVLAGLDFSANLVTMYVFYEAMTLTSLPLVLHEQTPEAVMAGLKYLFYSVAGAFLALFGIFFLASVSSSLSFVPGGVLTAEMVSGKEGVLLIAVCCMIIGFGAKAGMFPLHGWLPTAHPAAPAPASAVLSGVITKSGVLAVIRVIFYIVGPEMIRGTWVQTVWMTLALVTVFMGSMLAYMEPVMKKRLAYSTVSQVSYMMFGLSVLEPTAFVGALSHIVFHSLIKNALFLCAGGVIVVCGWRKVKEMRGLGRIMPGMLICWTVVSLGLIGIPPTSGFVSKWYLATGALSSGTGVFAVAGPAVLLVSALLTAGYLLPLTIQGFFPGSDFDDSEIRGRGLLGKELSAWMLVPIVILSLGALLFGCFPNLLVGMLQNIAATVL
jgi:multicomponent Na+:H+ antiporter subunit D